MSIPTRHLMAALLLTCIACVCSAQNPPPGMTRIPAGIFSPFFSGSNDLKEIRVKAFYLDALPVTVGDYLEFVSANPRWRRSQVKRIFADESYLKEWAGDLEPGTNTLLAAPVTQVSWFAAKAYADWKGKRLPSTAEWERVASAGFSRVDGENDPEFKSKVLEWYTTASTAHLLPVGGRPNYFGIQNLHGLVWEWTTDFNSLVVIGDARKDAAVDRELFCGGGSQGARDVNDFPAFMRYGFRSSLKADYCVHNLGFRCAKDL